MAEVEHVVCDYPVAHDRLAVFGGKNNAVALDDVVDVDSQKDKDHLVLGEGTAQDLRLEPSDLHDEENDRLSKVAQHEHNQEPDQLNRVRLLHNFNLGLARPDVLSVGV